MLAANANDFGVPSGLHNGEGAGVDPGCTLVSARVSQVFFGTQFVLFTATQKALETLLDDPLYEDVAVVNLSIQFNCPTGYNLGEDVIWNEMHATIIELVTRGTIVVAMAGNGAGNADILCPNSFEQVLCVAGTDCNDDSTFFATSCGLTSSNIGLAVDYAAPARGMYTAKCGQASCLLFPDYASGTSAAAPVVAGIVSLLYARANDLGIRSSIGYSEILACLSEGAIDLGTPSRDTYFGVGRVHAAETLRAMERLFYDCPTDLTGTTIPNTWGYGVANGSSDADDLMFFVIEFENPGTTFCDLTTTNVPGSPGYGEPNGVVDQADWDYFMDNYPC